MGAWHAHRDLRTSSQSGKGRIDRFSAERTGSGWAQQHDAAVIGGCESRSSVIGPKRIPLGSCAC